MNAHRMYSKNNTNVAKSVTKLSSGYRINSAADDAAGLAISEKMRAQIRGLTMASKNSQDAISLVQTAEGALQETHNILQRMRELAVQSASETNEQTVDRQALHAEFAQLQTEIDDIASKTRFNDQNILDGTFQADKKFLEMTTTNVTGLGTKINAISVSRAAAGEYEASVKLIDKVEASVTAGDAPTCTVSGNVSGSTLISDISFTGAATSAHNGNTYKISLADGSTLSNATFQLIDTNGDIVSTAQNVDMTGWASGATAVTYSVSFAGVGTLDFEIDVNQSLTSIGDMEGFLGGSTILEVDTDGIDATVVNEQSAYVKMTINGETLELRKGDTSAIFKNSGVVIDFAAALSDQDIQDFDADFILDGEKIAVGNEHRNGIIIQSGANQGDELNITIDSMTSRSLGIASSKISTQKDASNAISEVNIALNAVSTQRATLGALANRLEFKIANLDTSAENLQAAEGRIRDVDMAKEMTNFTKTNILAQASTAMLAQANALPQGVLQLLG